MKRNRTCPHTISHNMLMEEKYTLFEVWKRYKLSLFLITGLKYTDDTLLVNRRLQMQNVLSYIFNIIFLQGVEGFILTNNTYYFLFSSLENLILVFFFCTGVK